jgi:hypothetical protein
MHHAIADVAVEEARCPTLRIDISEGRWEDYRRKAETFVFAGVSG